MYTARNLQSTNILPSLPSLPAHFQELMQPVLDQFTTEDRNQSVRQGCVPLSCEEALRVMKDAFLSGAEREISIGDGVEIVVLRKGHRPRVEKLKLPQH